MGYDQLNRASALWQLGRYEEARAALDEAHPSPPDQTRDSSPNSPMGK